MRYVIREKLFRLTEDSDITNEHGHPVYHVQGKIFSLHHTLTMTDLAGHEVAQVRRVLLSLRPTYEITRGDQELAEVRKHFFTPFVDRFTIDIPGPDDLEMDGNLFEHQFIITRGGRTVATISKAWISVSDTYGVEIAPGEDDVLILASVLALDLAEDSEHS
jgi:uncharacterized protein YxjI